MAINLLSPGIEVREFDLTRSGTPQPRRPIGAIVGVFAQGPINEPTLIRNEKNLSEVFGTPDGGNDETFFTAAQYLGYSDRMYVVRVANNNPLNAYAKTRTEIDTITLNTQSGTFSNSDVINIIGGTTYTAANVSVTTNSNGAITALSLVNNGIYSSSDFPISAEGFMNIAANNQSNSSPTLTVNLTYRPVSVSNQESFSITNYTTTNADGRTILDDTQWRSKITANGYTTDTNVLWVARTSGNTSNGFRISMCDSANAYTQNLNAKFSAASANVTFVQGSKSANIVTSSNTAAVTLAAAFSYRDTILMEVRPSANGKTDGFPWQFNLIASKQVVGANVVLTLESPWSRPTSTIIVNGQNFRLAGTTQAAAIFRSWEFSQFTPNPANRAFSGTLSASDTNATNSPLKRGTGANTYYVVDKVYTVIADKDNNIVFKSSGTRADLRFVTADKKAAYDGNYHTNINNNLNNSYVWWANHRSGIAITNPTLMSNLDTLPYTAFLGNGSDLVNEDNIALNTLMGGYDLFKDKEKIQIDYLIQGKANGGDYGEGLVNYITTEICETRRDCMAFASPRKDDVTKTSDKSITDKLELWANAVTKSSFLVLDSGYKAVYDRYNDRFIDIPLNGDTAGLVARTTFNAGPWFSPAGFNRGEVRICRQLKFNPTQLERDAMYPIPININPYVQFRGKEAILFGDKTTYGMNSAFDRINVRQLFIYLQRVISDVAKFTLFEMNDEFTRAQFVGQIDPILRDVKGRRGIYDYRLICNETNNTPDIIDTNGFIADIYIKPARSINFIQLNFVATATGTEFSEIEGNFDTGRYQVL